MKVITCSVVESFAMHLQKSNASQQSAIGNLHMQPTPNPAVNRTPNKQLALFTNRLARRRLLRR
ncbi:MAG: hypothetical protein Q7K57_59430 [Burkholderiaceae bacterium]|nr:hypothetical protein [Burkholderiaceae bacterium]